MKVLSFPRTRSEDYLWLEFEGAFASQVDLERELESFFQAMEEHADGWMPEVVRGKRQRKYARAAIWKSLEESQEEYHTSLGLYRTQWPALDTSLGLHLRPAASTLNFILKLKPLSHFAQVERCRRFVDMVRAWAVRYPVSTHAFAHSSDDGELAGSPCFGRDMQTAIREGFDQIYAVYWLNVFGPGLVETVGRERMLSTPAHRVEELPNGAILLVTWPTAADFASAEAREAQARAHVHLRPDLELSTVRRSLLERSAALVPVEPRFHPDVAPFLSLVVEDTASHARPRKTAELNAWRPPEPEEWLPADAALPPDVEEPARALAHYSLLAEHLVALLHTRVPSVFDATPESLPEVDHYFWSEAFPRRFERENIDARAVPAVGAYLGQVLVRHLGGQWLPRRKLEETQVLVGQRAWLPFVRAHRYLRSCQSLLDCSLTQLYRVAERHRS